MKTGSLVRWKARTKQRLCTLMNKIHGSLSDTETYYESAGMNVHSSPALLRVLRKAHKHTNDEDIF